MLTDVELALLGDSVSANLLTERGEKLPCACGGEPEIKRGKLEAGVFGNEVFLKWEAKCKKCGNFASTRTHYSLKDDGSIVAVNGNGEHNVLAAWNWRWEAFSQEYFALLRKGVSPETEAFVRDLLVHMKASAREYGNAKV